MRYYETMVIVKPTLTEEERAQVVEWIEEIVKKNDGTLNGVEKIGVRQLAYSIQKFERGYYYIFYFTGSSKTVLELERQMRYNENLLRFMTVKYETKRDIARWEQMVNSIKA